MRLIFTGIVLGILLLAACGKEEPAAQTAPAADQAKPAEAAPAEAAKPAAQPATVPAGLTDCPQQFRTAETCSEEWNPVCGQYNDGFEQTFPNTCYACTQPDVVGYSTGACS